VEASESPAQERRRLLEQHAEIARLAGGLAHEIRNPLSTMSLNLELLAEDLADGGTPRDRRILNKILTVQRECRHLEQILDAFLQFARVGESDLVAADLNRVVCEFIEFYGPQAAEHGIEISPHLAADLPQVRMDEPLMRQVLMNLARNSQEAMPSGGLLELQTRLGGGRVELELIDNGCGMDERTQSKIYQLFFSTKPTGSGLGLPTVRRIVEAHHGTIRCQSEPGRGTRFTISLPVNGGEESNDESQESRAEQAAARDS
jgi:signal transduction histidine kinase